MGNSGRVHDIQKHHLRSVGLRARERGSEQERVPGQRDKHRGEAAAFVLWGTQGRNIIHDTLNCKIYKAGP